MRGNKMVGWHHQLGGCSEGQGSLECCSLGGGGGSQRIGHKLATKKQQSVVKNQGSHCKGTVHPWLGN